MINKLEMISKEELEPLRELTNKEISEKLSVSIYIVKKSLAHHGLYKGKLYTNLCPQCDKEFFTFTSGTKFCSDYCKHQNPWNKNLTKDDHPSIHSQSLLMLNNKKSKFINYSISDKKEVFLPNLGKVLLYDRKSNLEKEWLLQVDSVIGVVDVKNCDFYIPYIDHHKVQKQYHPDFIVEFETGLRWLVEVKGQLNENDFHKISYTREWCKENRYQYKIITTGMVKRSDWVFVHAEPKNIYSPSIETMCMNYAVSTSYLSISSRLRVGCVIMSIDGLEMLGYGFNGDEKGGSNIPCSHQPGQDGFIHAEENALLKVKIKQDAKMFITDMPCTSCAKRIINSAFIKEVYYLRPYRDNSGVGMLIAAGIKVYHYHLIDNIGKKYTDQEAFILMSPKCLL